MKKNNDWMTIYRAVETVREIRYTTISSNRGADMYLRVYNRLVGLLR